MDKRSACFQGATVHPGAAHGLSCNFPAGRANRRSDGTAVPHPKQPKAVPSDASSNPWETRIQILIAVALGLAAIVTAAAVYRDEQEEHEATKDFHAATSYLVSAVDAGIASPRGRELKAPRRRRPHTTPRITRKGRSATPSPR